MLQCFADWETSPDWVVLWSRFLLTLIQQTFFFFYLHPQLLPAQPGQGPQGQQPGRQPHRDELIGRSHQRPRPHAVQVASSTKPDQFVRKRAFLSKDTEAGCVQCCPQPPRQATVQLRQRLHQEEPLGYGLWRCVFLCVRMTKMIQHDLGFDLTIAGLINQPDQHIS